MTIDDRFTLKMLLQNVVSHATSVKHNFLRHNTIRHAHVNTQFAIK